MLGSNCHDHEKPHPVLRLHNHICQKAAQRVARTSNLVEVKPFWSKFTFVSKGGANRVSVSKLERGTLTKLTPSKTVPSGQFNPKLLLESQHIVPAVIALVGTLHLTFLESVHLQATHCKPATSGRAAHETLVKPRASGWQLN